MSEASTTPAEQPSLHDRIVEAAAKIFALDQQFHQIEAHGGIVKLFKGGVGTDVANCVGTMEFSATKGESTLQLSWHAQYSDSGNRLAMAGDKTVNYRRRATGNADEISAIEQPTIEQLLSMLAHANRSSEE